jgi:hypothetical protein
MSENIHNDDELYRKAYNNFEEEPSPGVWDKLNARLDQKDATLYRAKFTLWKRIAVVLIFLLGTALAYELFFKPGNTSSNPTAEDKQVKPAADSILQAPSSNQIQHPNNTTDSINLNQAEASVRFSPKQNNKQGTQYSDKNTRSTAVLSNTKEEHIKTSNTNTAKEIAEEKKTTNKQTRQPAAHENNDFNAEQSNKQETLDQSSKEAPAITDNGSREQNKTTLLYNNTGKNSDSITTNQHNDSTLTIHNKPGSTKNNTAANNKKSPIKIRSLFQPHFSISPYIAADFTGDQIDNDEHHRDPDRRDERHDIEDRENTRFSFSAGVLARYQFSKRLSLKSGLVYSNTAIHAGPGTLYAAPDNSQGTAYKYISSLGYAYVKPPFDQSPAIGDSIRCEQVEQHASYLSIPLMAGYTINAGKKLTIMPGIGFTTNLLLGSKAQTELHKDNEQSKLTIKNIQGLAPVYFSFVTDVELHYQLNNNFSLMLLPSFKHAIVPTTSNHVVKTYPYNFGIGIGVTYGL